MAVVVFLPLEAQLVELGLFQFHYQEGEAVLPCSGLAEAVQLSLAAEGELLPD